MRDSDFCARYGPWALIAGASEGTGAAFAHDLAAKGLNLVLVARRPEPLAALARDIAAAHPVDCVTASVDLDADDAVDRLDAAVGGREIGLFIANAGADTNGALFLDADIDRWNALAMRNVMTTMRACHHFGRPMRARGRGGLMLVGSAACYSGLPGIAVYAATKAFGLVLAEALWAELQPHGVDVLGLVMTQTDTPAHRELQDRRGLSLPPNCAAAEDVAAYGLDRLPHGPIANWGLDDADPGYAGVSAAARRARILEIAAMMRGTMMPAGSEA